MAEIMSKPGYKWLYDETRAKIIKALEKAGADEDKIDRFFAELDKKKRTKAGANSLLADAAFMDHLTEILNAKGITNLKDIEKEAPKYAKKISVVVRYKNNVIQLLIDKKQVVGVV